MPDHFLPFPAYISDDKVGNEILVIELFHCDKLSGRPQTGFPFLPYRRYLTLLQKSPFESIKIGLLIYFDPHRLHLVHGGGTRVRGVA